MYVIIPIESQLKEYHESVSRMQMVFRYDDVHLINFALNEVLLYSWDESVIMNKINLTLSPFEEPDDDKKILINALVRFCINLRDYMAKVGLLDPTMPKKQWFEMVKIVNYDLYLKQIIYPVKTEFIHDWMYKE